MSRLVIVSNRLPVTIKKKGDEFEYFPSSGGLATGLNSLDKSYDMFWIGWPGQEVRKSKERERVTKDLAKDNLAPVFLTPDEIELYYEGFSNKTIWPHFHYFTEYTTYRDDYWEAYLEVNRKFFAEVKKHLRDDDMVWVHDYQLMLLPQMIREEFPEISIGFFLHIPFPSYEIFRILPWRDELLHGLLGADQIGFHTWHYMRHFISAVYRITGYEQEFGRLHVGERTVNVDVFPMGIDYEKYAYPDVDAENDQGSFDLRELHKNRKIIMSVDRLDYTKGIPQRVRAFAKFMKENPKYHRKVVMIMIVVPSRDAVDTYKDLKQEIDVLVSKVNSHFGTFDWMPIQYYYRSLNFAELTTLYKESDIAMVTPLRDGMNLVAKEYIAAKEENPQGVIILSEMAGAVHELNDALIVNPQDAQDICQALKDALEMSEEEQKERLQKMQELLRIYNVKQWAANFIHEQRRQKEKNQMKLTAQMRGPQAHVVRDRYRNAKKRLFIIDYDGTLMDFHVDPQAVAPEDRVLKLLTALAEDPKNRIVINSGRDRKTLDGWLGHLGTDMATEHGVWMKENNEWTLNSNVSDVWKEDVQDILENLVSRTPGSFIEEKDYSLAWHYRGIDRGLGEKRVREFKDMLAYLIQNQDLQILEGNKVVEIKNAGVNKGKATQHWVNQEDWDFMLGIGDDSTDEDIFRAMPEDAITIKVGPGSTEARYNLPGVAEVREFFEGLVEIAKTEA